MLISLSTHNMSAPVILFVLLGANLSVAATPRNEPGFNRDIRPILSDNCFKCHGPEQKSREAKLRLDDREIALAKEAIVPGRPDDSEMILRLLSTDPDEHMPPAKAHKEVSPAEIELLKAWIANGAKYEPHWSYTPVRRPEPPKTAAAGSARDPIDGFILARLEQAGIAPAAPADRPTLLRRLALDLTGLPPTPAEVERFTRDRSRDAYAKEVERLLSSPHYGERMAVPWLDAVRFADTVGYHGDQNQNIFPYRDYVIASFNQNKPFDRFTIEQIAGDLLPDPTLEQLTATGFNRLNMMTREGGAQPKEYLAKYAADRVRTVSTVWMGSTMACCECHDHKFDPFSQKDFYALGAFFADVKQWGVYSDYKYTPNPDLAGFTNEHPFPPEITVPSPFLQQRERDLRAELSRLLVETGKTVARGQSHQQIKTWQTNLRTYLAAHPDGWSIDLQPAVTSSDPEADTRYTIQSDETIRYAGKSAQKAKKSEKDDNAKEVKVGEEGKESRKEAQLQIAPPPGRIAALRLELFPDPVPGKTAPANALKTATITLTLERPVAGKKSARVTFHRSDATTKLTTYDSGAESFDVHPRWSFDPQAVTSRQFAVYLPEQPLDVKPGDTLIVNLESDDPVHFRLATTPLAGAGALDSGATPELAAALARPQWLRSKTQKELITTAWLLSTRDNPVASERYLALDREILNCRHGQVPTLVTVAVPEPPVTRVLPRGNWQDESGPVVAPAVPHFLPQPDTDKVRLTRLDLAEWLVSRDNPLTARAFVNRLWKQFFGYGLSSQLEDIGTQGEPPSHPELLDWLAAEFIASGWDVKHMVRLMVNSATYQQDAANRLGLREQDPNNRWLSHQNPRRLEAEFVRDNALFIAGLLNPAIGGPSAFPYQPEGYYANIQFPNRTYAASRDDLQYRRGLYTHWQRTFLHPMLANFDAPSREECTVDRPRSITPQQALTLLNDPTFVEAARAFAVRLLLTPKIRNDAERVRLAITTALLRPAQAEETASLLEFLATQRTYYSAHPEEAGQLVPASPDAVDPRLPAAERAAWTSLARVVLNLHETITRY